MKATKRWRKAGYRMYLFLLIPVFCLLFYVKKTDAATTLNNPVIESSSSMKAGQKVTYDCIWFGSYPKTEIVDQAGTCGGYGKAWLKDSDYEINSSLYNTLSGLTGWDSNNDIVYQGEYYHRMKKDDALETNSGSEYYEWTDDTSYHFFRYDKIKWRILNLENGKAFLLADQVLDAGYYTTGSKYTWENCSSRAWLNDYFLNKAFSQEEQELIQTTSVINVDESNEGAEGENDTEDKIFYLSEYEVSTDSGLIYGFTSDGSRQDEARKAYSSLYTKARGDDTGAISGTNLYMASWRLRSPGQTELHPEMNRRYIDWYGKVGNNGYSALMGVRPALNISLSASELYSYAGTVCTDGTVNEVEYSAGNTTTYIVNYDANGGSETLARQTKTKGTDLVLSSTLPTRTGYTFMGWGTTNSATTVSYIPGGTYSKDADITLYAIWRKSITLTYNSNGGTNSPGSVTGYAYNSSVSHVFTITDSVPTKSGYTFLGWSASSSATSASYTAGDQITLSSDKTLYAVWEGVQTTEYTVSYDANGGSGAPASQTKSSGVDLTLSSTIPERDGYTFMGWGTGSSSTTVSYSSGASYSQDADITLYAIWRKTVKLTMDGNGGMMGNAYSTSITKYLYNSAANQTFTISTAVTPTRTGYEFLGWGTTSSTKTVSYQNGDSISISSDTTLYAIWRKGIVLSYDLNGGSGSGIPSSVTGYIYNAETAYTFTISDTKPSWEGYSFVGWGTSADATSTYGSGENITITENTTLYAIWTGNSTDKKVTLTYSDANGGENIPASRTVDQGSTVNLSGLNPTKDGYVFLGWNSDRNATDASYAPGDAVDLPSDLTLYAIWEKTILLSYDANGGSGAPSQQKEKIYNTTTTATFLIDSKTPQRSGYTFLGWNNDDNALYAAYAPGDAIDLSLDLTLYAVWKKNEESTDNPTTEESGSSQTNAATKKAQTLTAGNKTMAINSKSVSLGAKSSGDGKLTYKSSATSVATVSAAGLITPKAYGVTTITIKAAETSNCKAATRQITVTVVPKKMVIKSAKAAANRAISLKWKKDKTVSGYEVQICLRKDFKSGAYQRFYKTGTVKKKITNLKKKTWYVRIRAYKKIGKKTYSGIWSNTKKVKVK